MPSSREMLETMSRFRKRYHDTALYTAVIVTLILFLQIVSMVKGGG